MGEDERGGEGEQYKYKEQPAIDIQPEEPPNGPTLDEVEDVHCTSHPRANNSVLLFNCPQINSH